MDELTEEPTDTLTYIDMRGREEAAQKAGSDVWHDNARLLEIDLCKKRSQRPTISFWLVQVL